MDPIVSRCGYRCDLCLAYRPNLVQNPANSSVLSDGWHKYFGFRIPPESVVCDGCMAPAPQLVDRSCPVRPCVIAKGLTNCARCPDFVCGRLRERLVDYDEIARRFGGAIPETDRQRFIAPYENRVRLERLRDGAR